MCTRRFHLPPRLWAQHFLTVPRPSGVLSALAGVPWKHPARISGQGWGSNPVTHCAILGELVPLLASLLVYKIRKADPTFCKVSPGYITHLHTAPEL